MSNNDNITTKTLKQEYDEMNDHLKSLAPKWEAFKKAKYRIKYCTETAEEIFNYFSCVRLNDCGKFSTVCDIQNHRIRDEGMVEELQKYLDENAPEKIKVTLDDYGFLIAELV